MQKTPTRRRISAALLPSACFNLRINNDSIIPSTVQPFLFLSWPSYHTKLIATYCDFRATRPNQSVLQQVPDIISRLEIDSIANLTHITRNCPPDLPKYPRAPQNSGNATVGGGHRRISVGQISYHPLKPHKEH
jgi:hypothetical protein